MSESTTARETGDTLAKHRFDPRDRHLILAHVGIAVGALLIGAVAGLLQVVERAGWVQLPGGINYYQMLTVHGVLLALVFTTFFIFAYLYAGLARTLDGQLIQSSRTLAWIGYGMMTLGTVLALVHILTNDASVLYTFYPPLHAAPWFYVGLALLVVGSWLASVVVILNYIRWRKKNKGEHSPLFAYMALAIVILWLHASLFVAIEVVVQLIPWAFGWVDRVNVSLSRTLFWYFGHALVYFWLLPAYIYWYVNIPQIIGGKIFSSSLPRLTFILFILFSIPVGLHHQLNDPGVESFWKYLQVTLTMAVVVPTLITAFSILATFEMTGRDKGAKGLFGWVKKLPWKDVRFFTPFVAMAIFIVGGAGGVVQASYQLNQLVHNTWFITGHFHMTLASTVGLTYFAALYWMIPIMRNRKLTPGLNRLGIIQTVT
ncbi:cbb3-type cytochrome c oxidase subunit I [Novibacillus thermophilus]|uniref:cbb3-type cytochrome c oxidase subunit I n=1 Tax=Novibacillus thermophilus TaxID=1471761 RepID=UPI0026802FCF